MTDKNQNDKIPSTEFDQIAFSAGIKALLDLKAKNAETGKDMRQEEGKAILAILFPAIAYGCETWDLQPLARFIKDAKPDALTKRVILQLFPSHELVIRSDKSLAFVTVEGLGKTFDSQRRQVLYDAFASHDSIYCDQIKEAFKEPEKRKDQIKEV